MGRWERSGKAEAGTVPRSKRLPPHGSDAGQVKAKKAREKGFGIEIRLGAWRSRGRSHVLQMRTEGNWEGNGGITVLLGPLKAC